MSANQPSFFIHRKKSKINEQNNFFRLIYLQSEISVSNEINDGIHHRKETTSRDLEDARLESTVPDHGLYYAVNDMPPWYINLSVGFQVLCNN